MDYRVYRQEPDDKDLNHRPSSESLGGKREKHSWPVRDAILGVPEREGGRHMDTEPAIYHKHRTDGSFGVITPMLRRFAPSNYPRPPHVVRTRFVAGESIQRLWDSFRNGNRSIRPFGKFAKR